MCVSCVCVKDPIGVDSLFMMTSEADAVLQNCKQLSELIGSIRESLSKSLSRNESLLEGIESSEVRATQTGSNEVEEKTLMNCNPSHESISHSK